MATSEVKSGRGYTAPKGRPTVHRTGQPTGRRMSSTMQWVLAIIVFLIVLGAIFYFARGFRTVGGGGHSGLPADASIIDGSIVQVRAAAAALGLGTA